MGRVPCRAACVKPKTRRCDLAGLFGLRQPAAALQIAQSPDLNLNRREEVEKSGRELFMQARALKQWRSSDAELIVGIVRWPKSFLVAAESVTKSQSYAKKSFCS